MSRQGGQKEFLSKHFLMSRIWAALDYPNFKPQLPFILCGIIDIRIKTKIYSHFKTLYKRTTSVDMLKNSFIENFTPIVRKKLLNIKHPSSSQTNKKYENFNNELMTTYILLEEGDNDRHLRYNQGLIFTNKSTKKKSQNYQQVVNFC